MLCKRTADAEGLVYRIDACGGDVVDDGGCWPKRLRHVGLPSAMALTPSKQYFVVTGEQGRLEKFGVGNCETVAVGDAAVPFPRHALGLGDLYAAPDGVTRLVVPEESGVGLFNASSAQIFPLTTLALGSWPAASGLLTTPGLAGDICPLCQP